MTSSAANPVSDLISMKIHLSRLSGKIGASLALAVLCATPTLRAQTSPPPAEQSADQSSDAKLSSEDLSDLLGPIALYPDALVALILPASTVSSDITLAARYLENSGDSANLDDQPWDPSVKALARYPDVLKWMDENLEWTNSLGEAFVEQPSDVMNAVQTLRAEAKAKGNLVDTPQQTVVVEKESHEIRIVPTEPDVIYVPQYDSEVVYVREYQPDYGPVLAFSAGFAAGAWLSYDVDWRNQSIYYGNDYGWNNHARWNDRGSREGNVNVVNTTVTNTTINNVNSNRWQASANSRRQFEQRQHQNIGNARLAKANAEIRNSNTPKVSGQPGHTEAGRVPKPARLNTAHNGNSGKHPDAEVRTPEANAKNQPNRAPDLNSEHSNAPANKPGGASHHAQPETPAPSVSGQSNGAGAEKKHPNKNPGVSNPGEGANAPKHKPSAAPSIESSGSEPPKKHNNPERPQQPSAAPQSAPHAQEPSSSTEPKHHQQPKPAPPGQPQVQQSQPQAHPNASGQQGNTDKKKKKDNDN